MSTTNHTDIVNERQIAKAIEALGWNWLTDRDGTYHVRIAADEDHGSIETEYRFSIQPEIDNSLILRLYAIPWLLGMPESVLQACNDWTAHTLYPKAALIEDDEGDTRLLLEWVVSCYEEPIGQSLVNGWIQDFVYGCSTFLARNSDVIRDAERYQAVPSSETIN